jgi:hypothetical protein
VERTADAVEIWRICAATAVGMAELVRASCVVREQDMMCSTSVPRCSRKEAD